MLVREVVPAIDCYSILQYQAERGEDTDGVQTPFIKEYDIDHIELHDE